VVVTTNKLRVLRAERRISQLRVAIGAGLGTTHYWAIENGYAKPTEAERAAIARALNVPADVIWPPETIAAAVTSAGCEACAG
jgi:transcriptional regulator with XRE-family HTH domain